MNCEQFENRVQLLLDSRCRLPLDLQLQQHARICKTCAEALSIFQCFGELAGSAAVADDMSKPAASPFAVAALPGAPVPSRHPRADNHSSAWKSNQRQQVRRRFILAAAALFFVGAILIIKPEAQYPVAQLEKAALEAGELTLLESPIGNDFHLMNSLGLTSLVNNSWSTGKSWSNSLTEAAYVDLSSLGRIDFYNLVPEESVRVVRSIPATIESIQPLYQYSTDFPVMKQWSSGINYTIGLIQNSLSQSTAPSHKPKVPGTDLGSRIDTPSSHLNLCQDSQQSQVFLVASRHPAMPA